MVKYLTRAAVSDELAELQRVRMLLEDGPGQETCVWKQLCVIVYQMRMQEGRGGGQSGRPPLPTRIWKNKGNRRRGISHANPENTQVLKIRQKLGLGQYLLRWQPGWSTSNSSPPDARLASS